MSHELTQLLKERIVAGLKRRSITTCSQWAEMYRIMGKPFPGLWTFKYHPWTKDIHDDDSEILVCQKGAQLAMTETALNKVFFAIDVKGNSCLYVLPAATPDAGDFSSSRFDKALELSEHLSSLFSDVRNVGHKKAGDASLFLRGSRSRSQLKSLPVALAVVDELDEMVQENVSLIQERLSGQIEKQIMYVSTPTIDDFGINAKFKSSSQNHYYFRCPHCLKLIELSYPESLVITAEEVTDPRIKNSHIICKECKNPLEHQSKTDFLSEGEWVQTYTNREISGYYINQLYSSTVRPAEIASQLLKAQLDPTEEQEFYNSKLGIPHIVKGARINEVDIKQCIGEHLKVESSSGLITMGVDVGKWIHYEIDKWFLNDKVTQDISLKAFCRVITEGKVLHFEELDILIRQYGIIFTVIDANPEYRKALEFAQRFEGVVRLCYYSPGIAAKNIHLHDEELHTMSVNRTSWMDLALGRFKNKRISIPRDTSIEYRNHLKAPVRIYEKDSDGNPVGKYVSTTADHFAHARTYAEMALPLAVSLADCQDIKDGIY